MRLRWPSRTRQKQPRSCAGSGIARDGRRLSGNAVQRALRGGLTRHLSRSLLWVTSAFSRIAAQLATFRLVPRRSILRATRQRLSWTLALTVLAATPLQPQAQAP